MTAYECRWPSNHEDWTPVDALDPQDAAESHAEDLCIADNDCYAMFEHGEYVEVRLARSNVADTYRVTCEFPPTFRAARR